MNIELTKAESRTFMRWIVLTFGIVLTKIYQAGCHFIDIQVSITVVFGFIQFLCDRKGEKGKKSFKYISIAAIILLIIWIIYLVLSALR